MPKDSNTTDSAPVPPAAKLQGWFAGRLPDGWFAGPPAVSYDRDEIVVVGELPTPTVLADGGDADPETVAAACRARIQGFREDTRALRMRIADEAEARFARKVAWGASCGDEEELFTTLSVPVMTRLRLPERQVLTMALIDLRPCLVHGHLGVDDQPVEVEDESTEHSPPLCGESRPRVAGVAAAATITGAPWRFPHPRVSRPEPNTGRYASALASSASGRWDVQGQRWAKRRSGDSLKHRKLINKDHYCYHLLR